ncbi:MAG TPA: NDMA-dependent alcohol dehydrogenase [Solirubrobacteraceae bacterium]|jgi:S-(hydroxymethyl)glutathione dehydrogenase/alcohol dehydrogenase|nr:NDMA-dependent alcohol dehydrogenase [Solirubrobacteraceae bacterium]
MKTRGAILREIPGRWDIVELDLDAPRQNELTVKLVGSGLCHSEVHLMSGNFPNEVLPVCGGHEGAGVVVEVGPNTPGFQKGDHVVLSALPACGRCRFCNMGQTNLCDLNAHLLSGARFDDPGSYRMSLDGRPVAQFVGISCFSQYTTVNIAQAVKVEADVPLDKACLVGCAVATGWGSAVNMASPQPGDTVIVMGVGGIGSFALQGAMHAGATNVIACDPVAFKREAAEQLGATHSAAHIDEAAEIARSLTNGQGADATIIAVGDLQSEYVGQALASIRKGGTTVVTGIGPADEIGAPISLFDLTLSQKRLQGSMYGGTSFLRDVPRLLHMYIKGQLNLDQVITRTYTLDQVNEGYDAMAAGTNVRGVIVFE